MVGIVTVDEPTPNAFRIYHKSKGRHRVIRGARFFRYYKQMIFATMAVTAECRVGGILTLDLSLHRRATRYDLMDIIVMSETLKKTL